MIRVVFFSRNIKMGNIPALFTKTGQRHANNIHSFGTRLLEAAFQKIGILLINFLNKALFQLVILFKQFKRRRNYYEEF